MLPSYVAGDGDKGSRRAWCGGEAGPAGRRGAMAVHAGRTQGEPLGRLGHDERGRASAASSSSYCPSSGRAVTIQRHWPKTRGGTPSRVTGGAAGAPVRERRGVHGLFLAGSVPEAGDDGAVYDTALVFDPHGRLVAWHRKAHLYRPGLEHTVFSPGQRLTTFDDPRSGGSGWWSGRRRLPQGGALAGAPRRPPGAGPLRGRNRGGRGVGPPAAGARGDQQPVVAPGEPGRHPRRLDAARREPDHRPDGHRGGHRHLGGAGPPQPRRARRAPHRPAPRPPYARGRPPCSRTNGVPTSTGSWSSGSKCRAEPPRAPTNPVGRVAAVSRRRPKRSRSTRDSSRRGHPALRGREDPRRGAARHPLRRHPGAQRVEPPALPLHRPHRRARRREAKRLIGAGARRFWDAKRAEDGYDKGSGTQEDSPKSRVGPRHAAVRRRLRGGAGARPRLLRRYRAHSASSDGASVYPACQNLLLAARALGYGGVLTGLHHMADADLRALLGIPDERGHHGHITLGRPLGHHGPVRRRPLPELVFGEQWGQAPAWAVDPDGVRHRRRPPRPVPRADGASGASQYSLGVAPHDVAHAEWGRLT